MFGTANKPTFKAMMNHNTRHFKCAAGKRGGDREGEMETSKGKQYAWARTGIHRRGKEDGATRNGGSEERKQRGRCKPIFRVRMRLGWHISKQTVDHPTHV